MRDRRGISRDWRGITVPAGAAADVPGGSGRVLGMRKGPGRTIFGFSTGAFHMLSSAVSYSPTTLRLQYHRRCQA